MESHKEDHLTDELSSADIAKVGAGFFLGAALTASCSHVYVKNAESHIDQVVRNKISGIREQYDVKYKQYKDGYFAYLGHHSLHEGDADAGPYIPITNNLEQSLLLANMQPSFIEKRAVLAQLKMCKPMEPRVYLEIAHLNYDAIDTRSMYDLQDYNIQRLLEAREHLTVALSLHETNIDCAHSSLSEDELIQLYVRLAEVEHGLRTFDPHQTQRALDKISIARDLIEKSTNREYKTEQDRLSAIEDEIEADF